MKFSLNGAAESHDGPAPLTVGAVVDALGKGRRGVAVAVNEFSMSAPLVNVPLGNLTFTVMSQVWPGATSPEQAFVHVVVVCDR